MSTRLALTTLTVLAAAAPAAAQAQTQVAPGRVVVPFATTVPEKGVDAAGALAAVGPPDGGVVMASERGTPTLLQLTAGTAVVRYTGEGAGFSTAQFAAAARHADLTPDEGYGGEQTPASFTTSVPSQSGKSDSDFNRVLVKVTASGPGLAIVRVRDAQRRVLAQSLEPIYAAGTTTVRVPLTATGQKLMQARLKITVGHAFRDLLRSDVNGQRTVRLR